MKKQANALKVADPNVTFRKYGVEGIRKFVSEIKAKMALGKADWEIADALALNWKEYNDVKKEMYKWDTADLYDRPVEQQFIDYVARQEACIQDLQALIEESKKGTTAASSQTHLGAIRAKSDIFDKIIKTGQEMGILERAPERREIVGGVIVAQLTNDELRNALVQELQGIDKLVNKYGIAEEPPPQIEGSDRLPIITMKAEDSDELDKPKFTEDKRPFFARGAASKATAAKQHGIKRTKVTRNS